MFIYLLSDGYSSTVSTSREFHDAMLIPPNRQSRAIMADSLFPNDRKKQLTQEITLEPAAGQQNVIEHLLHIYIVLKKDVSEKSLSLTQHSQASNFVHKQSRHNVPRQDSQCAKEADKVDHVGVVLITEVQQAALFVMQEGAVDEAAVD